MKHGAQKQALLELIRTYLRGGSAVEVDGLGTFELEDGDVVFQPSSRPRVFLAYAKEDRADVRKLYEALKSAGFEPWMDEEKLLAGQNWPRAIQRAIELADFFVMCFSHRAVVKRGFFQAELRYALDVAARVPLDDIFLLPVRLSACDVPVQVAGARQYIDLFPDWEAGVKRLLRSLAVETAKRDKRLE